MQGVEKYWGFSSHSYAKPRAPGPPELIGLQKSMDTSCGLAVAGVEPVPVVDAVADVEPVPVVDADAATAVDAAVCGIPTTSPKRVEHLAVDLTTSRCVIITFSSTPTNKRMAKGR